jgi:hypothetical protein
MDKLVGEQLWMGILNVSDLGNHYWVFYTITQFLLTKNRISEAEQSRAFTRGFQLDLWCRISRRLEINMIPTTSIPFLKLMRLPSMFFMAPHKIVFYRIVSRQPHPLLSRRHHTSRQMIYRHYSSKWHRVSSRCLHRKSWCQLQHQRPSNNYAGSVELCILQSIWPFHCPMFSMCGLYY